MATNIIDSYISEFESKLNEGCILLIGPSAFYSIKNNKSLAYNFIHAVNEHINYKGEIEPRDDMIIGTTRLFSHYNKRHLEAKQWLANYWKKVDLNEYPLFSLVSQLKFSCYFYFGYDSLLFQSLLNFRKETKLYAFSNKDNRNPRMIDANGKVHERLPVITGEPPVIFNLFGDLSTPPRSANDVANNIYTLIAKYGNRNSTPFESIALALENSGNVNDVAIMGVDVGHWYNKLLVLVCTSFRNIHGDLCIFDKDGIEARFDSPLFLDSLSISSEYFSNNKSCIDKINDLICTLIKRDSDCLRETKYKIFISYATSDSLLVEKVVRICRELGFLAYFSHRDPENFNTWKDRAIEMIGTTAYFLVIGSHEYYEKSNEAHGPINTEQVIALQRKDEMDYVGINITQSMDDIHKGLSNDIHFDHVYDSDEEKMLENIRELFSSKFRRKL